MQSDRKMVNENNVRLHKGSLQLQHQLLCEVQGLTTLLWLPSSGQKRTFTDSEKLLTNL